jgi:hypothetical protein
MCAEYDPIGLFEYKLCFRINIQTFLMFSMLQINFKRHFLEKSKVSGDKVGSLSRTPIYIFLESTRLVNKKSLLRWGPARRSLGDMLIFYFSGIP